MEETPAMPDTHAPTGHARIDRSAFQRLAPAANAAMLALGKAVAESGLEPALVELVKVRASQMNGCAFCTLYHADLARAAGVEQRRLDLLPAWRDAGAFTPREQAALAWTEALTVLRPETAAEYNALAAQFSPAEIAALTAGIANINAWNRIAGGLRFTPPGA